MILEIHTRVLVQRLYYYCMYFEVAILLCYGFASLLELLFHTIRVTIERPKSPHRT